MPDDINEMKCPECGSTHTWSSLIVDQQGYQTLYCYNCGGTFKRVPTLIINPKEPKTCE